MSLAAKIICIVGGVFGLRAPSGTSIALGQGALPGNAASNVAVGVGALGANTSGGQNVAVGKSALGNNTTNSNSTAVGYFALNADSDGAGNTALGYTAGILILHGNFCTCVGWNALGAASGDQCTAIGANTLVVATGVNNTALGYTAGSTITSGNNNTLLGNNAQTGSATGIFRTVIGSGALGTADHQVMLGTVSEQVVAPGGIQMRTKAGTPIDGDYTNATDGLVVVDTSASKIWARIGGTWKGVGVA